MRFVKVTGHPIFVTCCHCHTQLLAGDNQNVHADVDGKPFNAFYCPKCTDFTKVVDVKNL